MAALDFPSSPTLNQIYSANGKSWIWDGSAWNPYGGTGSSMILLASATASDSAEILFDNVFNPSLYSEYVLKFQGLQPATDNVAIRVQLRSSTLANITDLHRMNNIYARIETGSLLGNTANVGTTTGWVMIGAAGNAANELTTGSFTITPIPGQWTHMLYNIYTTSNLTERFNFFGAGACEGTTAPAGVKIYMSSGNISIGTFQLYGIKK